MGTGIYVQRNPLKTNFKGPNKVVLIISTVISAFMAKIGPEIGTFILVACLNHVNKASSIYSYTAVHNIFISGLNLDFSYTALGFSLFFRIVLTVLLGRSNESAIADLSLVPSSTALII